MRKYETASRKMKNVPQDGIFGYGRRTVFIFTGTEREDTDLPGILAATSITKQTR